MTAATIHHLPARAHAVTLTRSPLLEEMFQAGREARSALDTGNRLGHGYWQGVFLGYAVAFDLVSRHVLSVVDPLARVGTAEEVLAATSPVYRFSDPGRARLVLRGCGVLFGYWMGTSENMDAEECAACGRRICTSMDAFTPCFTESVVVCPSGSCHDELHVSAVPASACAGC